LGVLRHRPVLILCVLTLPISTVDRIYYPSASPYLAQLGYSDGAILQLMSLGQLAEIPAMMLLGWLLLRWGFKPVLIVGVLMQAFRYAVFAFEGPFPLLLAALAAHGFCYTLYFPATMIALDRCCTPSDRAGVQQLFTVLIAVGGTLGGSLLAGKLGEVFARGPGGGIAYGPYWAVPAVAALVLAGLVAALFRERDLPAEPGAVADRS
jgi:MFS family permease